MVWQEWYFFRAFRKVGWCFRKGYPLSFAPDGQMQAAREFTLTSPALLVVDYSSDPVGQQALTDKIDELLLKEAILSLSRRCS